MKNLGIKINRFLDCKYHCFAALIVGLSINLFSLNVDAQQIPANKNASVNAANAALTPPQLPAPTDKIPSISQSGLSSPSAVTNNAATSPGSASDARSNLYSPLEDPSAVNETDPAVVDAARDQAFNQLALNTLPMTPNQIQKLRNLFADSNRAATTYPGGTPPKPVSSTQLVSLTPGATPPIIRLAQGYVTSLVLLDETGAPWPIQAYDVGNPTAFNIQWDRTSNILMIQSSALYTTGNLVIQLKGLNTPISISLIPGQPIVDYRVDMRVQGRGPNARLSSGSGLPAPASSELLNVLDGVPPAKSRSLLIPGSNSQAWLVGNGKGETMYIRTHFTLLSPAWIASMSSADGTNAYQIPKTPSILVSDNQGKIFNLRIEGY